MILLVSDSAPHYPRALMDMYEEINVVFLPVNTTSILPLMDRGVIAAFKSCYLTWTCVKATDVLVIPLIGLGKIN